MNRVDTSKTTLAVINDLFQKIALSVAERNLYRMRTRKDREYLEIMKAGGNMKICVFAAEVDQFNPVLLIRGQTRLLEDTNEKEDGLADYK